MKLRHGIGVCAVLLACCVLNQGCLDDPEIKLPNDIDSLVDQEAEQSRAQSLYIGTWLQTGTPDGGILDDFGRIVLTCTDDSWLMYAYDDADGVILVSTYDLTVVSGSLYYQGTSESDASFTLAYDEATNHLKATALGSQTFTQFAKSAEE
jgi:hypothetical protein